MGIADHRMLCGLGKLGSYIGRDGDDAYNELRTLRAAAALQKEVTADGLCD